MSFRDKESALFISDLHLSPAAPEVAARFLAFLEGPARTAGQLCVLGDLFDYWAGDDDLTDPFNAHIAAALRALGEAGTAVSFMAGNRDFLIGPAFATAAGLRLLPDPCVCEIAGTTVMLTHGDTLCTDDTRYQAFRAMVRTPEWAAGFLAKPLAVRKQEIAALREHSEAEKQTKPMTIMDVNGDAVAAALRSHGIRTLIHGHTHRQGQHRHSVDGHDCQRWVLGDWNAQRGNALACGPSGNWHWLDFS